MHTLCVVTLWFRRNAWKPAVRLFLRMDRSSDHRIERQKSRLMEVHKSTVAGCSCYMHQNTLCLRHVSNALGQSKCMEAYCAVVSWDGTDPYRIAERLQMRHPEITGAGVSLFLCFSVSKSFFRIARPSKWTVSRVPNTASNTCKICIVEIVAKVLSNLYIEVGTWLIIVNTQKERKIQIGRAHV